MILKPNLGSQIKLRFNRNVNFSVSCWSHVKTETQMEEDGDTFFPKTYKLFAAC